MTRMDDDRDDEGAVLVLVLAFLAAVGVVTLALLSQSGVGVKSTVIVADFGKKVYSADSALDVALEAVQNDTTLCPDISATPASITTSLKVDTGIDDVKVTCKTTAGSAGGYKGYSIITTDGTSATSLATQSGPSKMITGPVFVAGGTDLKRALVISGGNYTQARTPCTDAGSVQVTAPYSLICNSSRPTPTLDAIAPAVPGVVNPAPDTTTKPGCSIFSPGRYTTKPALDPNRNYFKSGVYYFDFAGVWDINKTSVVGGTAGSETTNLDAPCLQETTPNGDGVTWVFRGSSALTVSNQSHVELFSRHPVSPDGTPDVSVFVQGTRVGSSIDQTNGNPQVVFHGLVYSPDASVGTNATGGVSFYMLNGVVASRLLLQSTSDGLLVSTSGGATARNIVLEATASKGTDARDVVARVVGSVQPDGTLKVLSRWSR
jgi:hypothetical protein